jgi:hypothetical protein
MTTYALPEQLRDELLRYLLGRPCGEVMNGVAALQSLQPVKEPGEAQPDGAGGS